ncbi:MAG: amidase family protein, partial [bacterium]
AGIDKKDSTSAPVDVPDYNKNLRKDIKGMIIGLPKEYMIDGMDKQVKGKIMEAVKLLEASGAKIIEISLPHTEYALDVYYVVAPAEASSNLARFDGVQYGLRDKTADNLIAMYKKSRQAGFGKETKRRIMLGTYVLSSGYYDAYYKKAQKVRTLIKNDFDKAFEQVDVILTPTSPTTAFKIGEKAADPLTMYLSDIFTIAPNMAGLPGISVPAGFDDLGLPIGMQVLAAPFAEQKIYDITNFYQMNTNWHEKRATL